MTDYSRFFGTGAQSPFGQFQLGGSFDPFSSMGLGASPIASGIDSMSLTGAGLNPWEFAGFSPLALLSAPGFINSLFAKQDPNNRLGGGISGGLQGAALGSIFPGIGTAIGAGLGFMGGVK